jgi:surfactin synthase thioesterase subunit
MIDLLTPTPNPGAATRLVCLPHAGGGPSPFFGWAELVGPQVEVCAVALPGREGRSNTEPYQELEPLCTDLYAAVEPLLDRPLALFGHSFGALVAFGLTRELRRRGAAPPCHLFVAAYHAPQLAGDYASSLHVLPDEEFLTGMAAWYPQEDLTDGERELLVHALPALRADVAVCERFRYEPQPPLATPISAFGGISDGELTREALAAWAEQTTGRFRLRMVPGGHLFYRESAVRLLRAVDRDLEAVARVG